MVDDPVQRTIAQLPIGFEHGEPDGEDAKCCICCGGCYSGCCACKPQGDLKLTVIQWYAKYETGGSEYSWKKINTPCDVEVTLTKRTYECMGSGAQEDNRLVDDEAGGLTDMTAVNFYLKYGRYAQDFDGDSPTNPLPDGGPVPAPMSLSEAQHMAYNDWWRTTERRVRGTACSVFPPIIAGTGIEIVNGPSPFDLPPLEEPHKPGITNPNPDEYENRESWSRETWGFTGKICSGEAGCDSKNYEPYSTAAGTDSSNTSFPTGFPDWKFRTNDCDGMCISINLCCCKMDGFEGAVFRCASDTNGTFAVHPDVDADADTFLADGKPSGVSTPFDLYWEQDIDLSTSLYPHPPEFYGAGYTFDEKTDEYPCKSECFKLSLNPYNCYTYSGAEGPDGASVDGSIIDGVGPFPMTQVLHNAVPIGPPGALYPHYEEKHKFNTPCSPCTYLEKGFYYPDVFTDDYWDAQPYGAAGDINNVAWNYADDGDTALHQTEKGMRFLQHVPVGDKDKMDEWDITYEDIDKGNLYYLPNRPTQCKCPRDEGAEEGEKGCTVDRKFMLKYAVVFESNCDCTIGIDADAVFPGDHTNAPIENLGPVGGPVDLVPRYAIDREWLGANNRNIIANPPSTLRPLTADPSLRNRRTRQPIKGVFRWDILITEAD